MTRKNVLIIVGSRGSGGSAALRLAEKRGDIIFSWRNQQQEGQTLEARALMLTGFNLPVYRAYAAMKGAPEVLTGYQAKELRARIIRVNTIAPGAIEKDFGEGTVRDNSPLNGFVAAQIALRRKGLPQDIGDAVTAQFSHESGWVNGQRIEVSERMFL